MSRKVMEKEIKDLVTVTESLTIQKNLIIQKNWYITMIEECQANITESIFTSRWALIEGYHRLGERIDKEKSKFNRAGIYGKQMSKIIAESLNQSRRNIDRAIQFYRKYPDINNLPEGKNISWHKICNKYLSESKKECNHIWEQVYQCKKCRKVKKGR